MYIMYSFVCGWKTGDGLLMICVAVVYAGAGVVLDCFLLK